MSRSKKDSLLREEQGKRLTDELKAKYGSYGQNAKTKDFIRDLELGDHERIKSASLSRILHGHDPIDNHVRAFSKVLGVSEAFLLCYDDYRNERERKKAILYDELEKLDFKISELKNIYSRISKVTQTVVNALEDMNIKVSYRIEESEYSFSKDNDHYSVCINDNLYNLTEDKFLVWLDNPVYCIPISEEIRIHLCGVILTFPDNSVIELNMKDFKGLLYGMDEEINHGVKTWLRYLSYYKGSQE